MGMKIKIKRWIVTLTLLFLGVFLPLRSQPQSRIPVDTGEVNPSNPPRFKGFRASPSSIIQFYFSEAGKRNPLKRGGLDRKSTRLNSSHTVISYAVFCLKKKIIRYLST